MKNEVKKLILLGIILIVLAFVFIGLPLWAKLIVLVINSFIPDPIPVVDEVLMIVATLNDHEKIMNVKIKNPNDRPYLDIKYPKGYGNEYHIVEKDKQSYKQACNNY